MGKRTLNGAWLCRLWRAEHGGRPQARVNSLGRPYSSIEPHRPHIRQGSQEKRTNKIYTDRERGIYFKELAHAIMQADRPKLSRVCYWSGKSGKSIDVVILTPNSAGQQAGHSGRVSRLQSGGFLHFLGRVYLSSCPCSLQLIR